jgi:hypothetical protein
VLDVAAIVLIQLAGALAGPAAAGGGGQVVKEDMRRGSVLEGRNRKTPGCRMSCSGGRSSAPPHRPR